MFLMSFNLDIFKLNVLDFNNYSNSIGSISTFLTTTGRQLTNVPIQSLMMSPRKTDVLSLLCLMTIVMLIRKSCWVVIKLLSLTPPPMSIHTKSPSFAAITILPFSHLILVIGPPLQVLVGSTLPSEGIHLTRTVNTEYYTENNNPANVFSALTFMMSASLEHHSVTDTNSSLIDTLLVNINSLTAVGPYMGPIYF